MSTPPALKRWWVTNLRGAAGAAAALSAALSAPLSPLGGSSARTAAVVETNRVKRMASIVLRMRRISLMVSQIRLEQAEVSGFRRTAGLDHCPNSLARQRAITWSATRKLLARMVRVGAAPPDVGRKLPSTT